MYQVYTPKKDYKVLVRCMTYNQSKYIEDALNSFAMQQTDFPFVCMVMDDCSTDGEQDVIKSWMERECDMEKAENIEIEKSFITLVPHQSNANCHFAFYFLKENLYKKGGKAPMIAPWREHCEYEALCEGDDYWIDPEKLQKQVKFLDNNKEYSMCFHDAKVIADGDGISTDLYTSLEERDYTGCEILERWIVPTASILCRTSALKNQPNDKRFIHGDIVIFLTMAAYGKIRCLSETMSVYRRNANGVSVNHHIDIERTISHFDAIIEHFGNQYKDIVSQRKAIWCVYAFRSGRLGKASFQVLKCALSENVFCLFLKELFKTLFHSKH